jgi:signal transduction histidine kinase
MFYYLNSVEEILQRQKDFPHSLYVAEEGDVDYLLKQISDFSKSVLTCAEHQKCMTDDVLQLSRLRSNKLSVNNSYYFPSELLQTISHAFRAQAENKVWNRGGRGDGGGRREEGGGRREEGEDKYLLLHSIKGLYLTTQLQGIDNQMQLWGDTIRLNQVICNLLSNALKFTHIGGVKITMSVKDVNELKNSALG